MLVGDLYVWIFGRPRLQPINNRILQLALRGRGYNNWHNAILTGEQTFIGSLAREPLKLCIDIGANKGTYSKLLLTHTSATVIAFEPLPGAFSDLRKMERAYSGRFFPYNYGIGQTRGELDLYCGDDDSKLATFSPNALNIDYVATASKRTMKVPVLTLDDFFKEHGRIEYQQIDLIKIDTEGFEKEVLAGAHDTINRMKPRFIQIEFNWHQLFNGQSLWSLSQLLPYYSVYQLLPYGGGLLRVDPRKPESNIYHFSNFVFVRGRD